MQYCLQRRQRVLPVHSHIEIPDSQRVSKIILTDSLTRMSDIVNRIRQEHTGKANQILKEFEEDPSSLVVIQHAAGGRHVTAQMLLRERIINWFKNMMPKHEEIAVHGGGGGSAYGPNLSSSIGLTDGEWHS